MTGRINKILNQCINRFNLDLTDLTVLTEAATGPYLYSPVMAALGGAGKVYAIAGDSRYGRKEDVKELTDKAAEKWGVNG